MRTRSFLSTLGLGLALLHGTLGCGGGDQGIDEGIDVGDPAPIDSSYGADEPGMVGTVDPVEPVDPVDPIDDPEAGSFEIAPPIDTPAADPEPETP